MAKLTDSQLVILNGAAQRKDGAVLPFPKSLRINQAAATTVVKSLLKRGLMAEHPATKDDEIWRETKVSGSPSGSPKPDFRRSGGRQSTSHHSPANSAA